MDSDYDIAIIGMSCRVPGAQNVDEFWRNLADGVESIVRLSDQEILDSGVPASWLNDPRYVRAAPVLDEPGAFDAAFFGVSPTEARSMDPQHRILLELAHEALENAGYDPGRYQGRIGVFAGTALNTYFTNVRLNERLAEDYIPTLIGADKDFLSTRISYKLGLKGPSITVQTACSTSAVAVHLARQSLLAGETDMALAGAISVRVPHRAGYFYDAGGVVSPDGHVRAFDADANGTVFGSGGGMLVLKRSADAIENGDTIRAIIKGSAINNDGSEKAGYTAPSVNSQADAVVEALANAGLEADDISYVEAHGSGTPVGDPIEIRALTKAFRNFTRRSGYCALGSVKTSVGHLDAAAAVVGIVKTVLALEHRKIPASLNFRQPNPEIDFGATPFYVNTELRDWVSAAPRRAGVMSTGMGGTNAHIVLEEAPDATASSTASGPSLLILSAKTEAALDRASERLRDSLRANAEVNLHDVAYTLQVGRKALTCRRAVVCTNRDEAIAALHPAAAKRMLCGTANSARQPTVLLLPGIGDHYVGMGFDLYASWPVFTEEVDRCSRLLEPHIGVDIRRVIYPDSRSWKKQGGAKGIDLRKMLGHASHGTDQKEEVVLNATRFAQPALFTIEYAMSRLWQSLGVVPDAIVGHSMGEYVAACLAGVLSLEDALALVAMRAKLVSGLPDGRMLAVMLPERELRSLLSPELSISLINGPRLCVVAGSAAPVAEFERMLQARGVVCRHVQNGHAFHSRMLDPIVGAFETEVRKVRLSKPRIPYISNVTGTWITDHEALDPAYWAMHANHTVRFDDALRKLWQLENPILLDAGPGRTLGVLAMQHPDRSRSPAPLAVSSIRHRYENRSDIEYLWNELGKLWVCGIAIEWDCAHAGQHRRRVSLPTYPFERQYYWIEARSDNAKNVQERTRATETSDVHEWFYVPTWERTPFARQLGCESRPDDAYWLVIADQQGGGSRITRKLHGTSRAVGFVRFGDSFMSRDDGSFEVNPRNPDHYVKLFREIKAKCHNRLNILHLGCVTTDGKARETSTGRNEDSGFFSLLYVAQALADASIGVPVRIGVISNRIHEITGDESLDPSMATALGLAGVMPKEFANVSSFSLDLPDSRPVDELADGEIDAIISEFAATSQGDVLAYRGRHRWRRKYDRVHLSDHGTTHEDSTVEAKRLREQGVYLITGGTGGVGLAFAKYLARTCHARLVLTKKTPFPEKSCWTDLVQSKSGPEPVIKTIRELLEIERLGAEVQVVTAEISDRKQMRRVVDDAIARYNCINGVMHAAGIVRAGLIQGKTRQTAESVLGPKVNGTRILFELLEHLDLDFLVLFSSLSSVTVPFAHCDYSAANCFLDAFAAYANSKTKFRTVSISWPVWKEVGVVAAMESLLGAEALKEQALESAMLTKDGLDAFSRLLNADLPHIVVSPENLDEVIRRAAVAFDPAMYGPRVGNDPAISFGAGQRGGSSEPSNEIEALVAEIWRAVFGTEKIGIDDTFSQLGGHSLLAMQIVARIRSSFQIDLSLRDFFEAGTIARLSAWVAARILSDIEGLTDDEARARMSTPSA